MEGLERSSERPRPKATRDEETPENLGFLGAERSPRRFFVNSLEVRSDLHDYSPRGSGLLSHGQETARL